MHEGGRDAVDRDRLDRHVRARHGRRARDAALAIEVQAELAQALRRLLHQLDVRARQELVGDGVVVDEDVAVDALVAAVAELRPHAVARLDERARAGRALGLRRAGLARRLELPLRELAAHRVAASDLEVGGARGAAERALVGAALRRARGHVVGALLQAGHLDAHQEGLRAVRGDVDGRLADQRPAGLATHHAHAHLGAGGPVTFVGDDAGQVAGLGARRQRADLRHPDARGMCRGCGGEHRDRQ